MTGNTYLQTQQLDALIKTFVDEVMMLETSQFAYALLGDLRGVLNKNLRYHEYILNGIRLGLKDHVNALIRESDKAVKDFIDTYGLNEYKADDRYKDNDEYIKQDKLVIRLYDKRRSVIRIYNWVKSGWKEELSQTDSKSFFKNFSNTVIDAPKQDDLTIQGIAMLCIIRNDMLHSPGDSSEYLIAHGKANTQKNQSKLFQDYLYLKDKFQPRLASKNSYYPFLKSLRKLIENYLVQDEHLNVANSYLTEAEKTFSRF